MYDEVMSAFRDATLKKKINGQKLCHFIKKKRMDS
jgi:hypothetical protein